MPLANTATRFGSIARSLHWLTALLILTAIPLGLYANDLPYDTSAALAAKAQVFSAHKTLGIAAFLVAMVRIIWALSQPRPVPLHPERRLETAMADLVHWLLYVSLVAVPMTGWITHAATVGFAPILWPLGQDLPLVPKSATVAQLAGSLHWVFTKLLIAAILVHVAGALKHHLIDRDATLRRMISGTPAPDVPYPPRHSAAPMLAALAIYAAGAGLAVALTQTEPAPTQTAAPAATTGNWQVTDGTLSFAVRQMGGQVKGSFASWSALINFDESTGTGNVTVTIDMTSLTLGSVTDQAKSADFLDTATHPTATFTARVRREGAAYMAEGSLALRGTTNPLTLPFTLIIEGNTARMEGTTTIDRLAFGIGTKYPDEATIGFTADVTVTLTAKRSN